ncbi:MAG: hypothetical protein KAR13_04725, partial [Desulfobulbaceae bacterium]|nr:hypothetical protein [Desulfobulbaceae bacterium]
MKKNRMGNTEILLKFSKENFTESEGLIKHQISKQKEHKICLSYRNSYTNNSYRAITFAPVNHIVTSFHLLDVVLYLGGVSRHLAEMF